MTVLNGVSLPRLRKRGSRLPVHSWIACSTASFASEALIPPRRDEWCSEGQSPGGKPPTAFDLPGRDGADAVARGERFVIAYRRPS
jgi:hypothetical protein